MVDLKHKLASFAYTVAKEIDMKNFGHYFISHFTNLIIYDNIFISLLLSHRSHCYVPKYFKLILIIFLNAMNTYLVLTYKPIDNLIKEVCASIFLFVIYNLIIKKYYFFKWYYNIEAMSERASLSEYLNATLPSIKSCAKLLKSIKSDFSMFFKFEEFYYQNMYENIDLGPSSILVCTYLICLKPYRLYF